LIDTISSQNGGHTGNIIKTRLQCQCYLGNFKFLVATHVLFYYRNLEDCSYWKNVQIISLNSVSTISLLSEKEQQLKKAKKNTFLAKGNFLKKKAELEKLGEELQSARGK